MNESPAATVSTSGVGWLPISTAPKDGAPVLACIAGQSKEWIAVACWVRAVEQWRNPAGYSTYFNLTHWMPLPAPPATA